MPAQNTVSGKKLTENDTRIFEVVKEVAGMLEAAIPDAEQRAAFKKEHGRLAPSRDAGSGVGAGKLQRDALTTRGRQGKAPFSNRNLRWHPLLLSEDPDPRFTPVDALQIAEGNLLAFTIKGRVYLPEEVYQLPEPAVISGATWAPIADTLGGWSTEDWMNNWCAIPVIEYCTAEQAVGSYAVLGVAIVASFYGVTDPESLYAHIATYLASQQPRITLPAYTPDILLCPLCKHSINGYPAGLSARMRPKIWKPLWQKNKRGEGNDESIQLTHVSALQEGATYHIPELTRYGHRWCNVSMTDHSVPETVAFFKAVTSAHSA
jgi:hypothetical protein